MTPLLLALAMGLQAPRPKPPVVGDRVAPFTLASRNGEIFSWKPGKATVLCFCAFWCDTWKDQLPRLQEARQALQGMPVDFATISVDGRWTERGQSAAVGRNLSDRGNRWCSSIGIDRVPYTLLIDKQGEVRWAAYGVLRSESLVAEARQCLEGKGNGGAVYLTFDDFPAPKLNDELLDVLRAEDVPATFFCVCSRLAEDTDVVKRAVAEGNELEIHAWVHDEAKTDIARCRSALHRYGGDGSLYRPHGSEYVLSSESLDRLPLHVDDPYDFQRPGADELIRRISGQLQPGCVIQLHSGVEDTIKALPTLIKLLRERGFTFKVLERLSG